MNELYNNVLELLTDSEIDSTYASDLIARAQFDDNGTLNEGLLLERIKKELDKDFKKSHSNPKVIFFVGPTGAGKTTTIGKIAAHLHFEQKRRVGAISTDTFRVAAKEPLLTFTTILKMPFSVIHVMDDSEALKNEVDAVICANPKLEYLLVDTEPFCIQSEAYWFNYFDCLYNAFEEYEREIRFIAPVTANYRNLVLIIDLFYKKYSFQYIFTKLDETDSYGLIYNLHRKTGNSIEYVTYGALPDDIGRFDSNRLIDSMIYRKNYGK